MPSLSIDWLADDTEEPESVVARSSAIAATTSGGSPATTRIYARSNRQGVAANQRVVSRTPNKMANRADRHSAVMRRPKDSKVVAILKKTGSILTWPFKL
jgi:hypothetical protein